MVQGMRGRGGDAAFGAIVWDMVVVGWGWGLLSDLFGMEFWWWKVSRQE